VNGLGRGAVYALLALGFVVIYKATGVVNFAHGSLVLVGGYLISVLIPVLGWPSAVGIGVVCTAVGALLLERLLISRARFAEPASLALMTIGIDVILAEEIIRRLGVSTPYLGEPFDGESIQVLGLTLFKTQVVALVVAAVLITAFALAFRYSTWGIEMRARSEDREAAALMGIRSGYVTASAWLVAGALAATAVVFIATQDFSGVGLSRSTHSIALIAFPAAIIGGLDSALGAVIGSLVVGVVEAWSAEYISFDFAKSAVFIVMLLVLVVAPAGLFGTKEVHRA
jgi:branched-chain amino acid transport system permease protein